MFACPSKNGAWERTKKFAAAGGADEEPLDAVDEEDLFSAVQRDPAGKAQGGQSKVPGAKTVSGSFFHVDGVGLVDENVVRSNPWMLNKASMPNGGQPGLLSTQPQGSACCASMVLSTSPVTGGQAPTQQGPVQPAAQASQGMQWAMQVPAISPGMPVVLDGLTNSPHFNGLSAVVESYDAETNRYNVQLPFMDRVSILLPNSF